MGPRVAPGGRDRTRRTGDAGPDPGPMGGGVMGGGVMGGGVMGGGPGASGPAGGGAGASTISSIPSPPVACHR